MWILREFGEDSLDDASQLGYRQKCETLLLPMPVDLEDHAALGRFPIRTHRIGGITHVIVHAEGGLEALVGENLLLMVH